jgi:hypothetical protein
MKTVTPHSDADLISLLASGSYSPETVPKMLRALSRRGGPERQIKEAQRRGAKLAGDNEAAFWLRTLIEARPQIVHIEDRPLADAIDYEIKLLRRRLGERLPPEEARAKTRERVRRFRERKRTPP